MIDHLKKLTKCIVAFGVLSGVVAGAWAFGDIFGFRPALIIEVRDVAGEIEVVGKSVDWLRLENYERRIARGMALTRRECADYRRLAARLGVRPKSC